MTRTQIIQAALNLKADDIWGDKTDAAVAAEKAASIARHASRSSSPSSAPPPANDGDKVDPRSEAAIATLHRKVQPVARAFVKLTAANGIKVEITSGTRTYAEQDALFNKHDGTTRARGGQSNHNFGLAFDVTIDAQPDDTLQPVWESPLYKKLGTLGESLGLTWGGRWQSIVDEPHFELHPPWAEHMEESQMLAELRRRHDNGIDAFA